MKLEQLEGKYLLEGSNQDGTNSSYKGILTLKLDETRRVQAHWQIGEQEQFGEGFFKNNILVINFHYFGEDLLVYKGTVVYHCLTKDILDGFWSEEYGNPLYLGGERCTRIKE
ncbi:hypothetical protein [Aureivirga sp. CE67]|uniref:hypothetical protein n=1 Tax=Aureivirga sp. CE67 TaxID=1788983 RepID=UPI0018CB9A3C|nr:hypothetical protein [Aureivirga sp. CE67]